MGKKASNPGPPIIGTNPEPTSARPPPPPAPPKKPSKGEFKHNGDYTRALESHKKQMQLRDTFANHALQGILAKDYTSHPKGSAEASLQIRCKEAYRYADAMMEARHVSD